MRELDVRLCRAGDDQAVDDPIRDGLGHRMSQQALHHHGPRVRRKQHRVPSARQVRQRRVLQRRRGHRTKAQCIARPAVDSALKLGCCVL